jgi:hypothetical protein
MNTPWRIWGNPFKFLTLDCNAWYHTMAFQRGSSRKGLLAMCRRNLSVLWLIVLVMSTSSCFLNPDEKKGDVPPPELKNFLPLTTKEAVLNNLELAYSKHNVTAYNQLLDDDFTFFLSPGDVGGNIPEQWDRTEELRVATLLFDFTLEQPPYPTCFSIRMDLKFESGVQWVDVYPEAFPTETWQMTTIYYEFDIKMKPDLTYIAVPGSQARLTVRNTGTEADPVWKLVEWQDLAGIQ